MNNPATVDLHPEEEQELSYLQLNRHLKLRLVYLGALAIAALLTGPLFYHTQVDVPQISIIFIAVIYAAISTLWIRQQSADFPSLSLLQNVISADSALIGAFIVTQNFDVAIGVSFLLCLQVQTIATCDKKRWTMGNLIVLLAMSVTHNIFPDMHRLVPNIYAQLTAVCGAFIVVCAYGFHSREEIALLKIKNADIDREKKLYKYRTHKLAQYLTPTVWNAINESNEKSLKTERKRITVFFSDIQDFSKLSEQMEAETLTALLNSYLTEMAKIAIKHGGTIDKFMGDAVMVLFGDMKTDGIKPDALRCLSMAIEMRRKMKEFQNYWYNKGVKNPLRIRMGINTGFCTVGSFGTNHYTDYTALGAHVNLASRLESAADAGEILISHETWALVKDVIMCRDRGEINVKGFSNPVKAYQVIDFRKNLGKSQTYYEENTQGFSMHIDLEKIKNYEKDKIVKSLTDTAERLRDRILK